MGRGWREPSDGYRPLLQRPEKHKQSFPQRLFLHLQHISFTVSPYRGWCQYPHIITASCERDNGDGPAVPSAPDQSMVWLMELISTGHCGSLALASRLLLLPPVYVEASVDNVLASQMRLLQTDRGQWRVEPRTTSHLGPKRGGDSPSVASPPYSKGRGKSNEGSWEL